MALIGKIRNNMWFVFVLIALATAAFILMDASGPGGFGGNTANTPIGVVAGQKIKQMDFERAYQALFNNAQDPNQGRELLWNFLVEDKIVGTEAEELGLSIGDDEMEDLQFGTNLSPIVRQNFTNPNTGQLDVAQLQQIKNQFESGGQINPQLAQFWGEQQNQIKKDQLEAKISSLAEKAIYTPNWLAESGYNQENGTVDAAVVKIPFDNIPAGDVTVSDADIKNYINKNKDRFELKEQNRQIDYFTLDVVPSSTDTTQLLEQVNDVMTRFATTPNDSTFSIANNGFITPIYVKQDLLDEFYADKLPGFVTGEVNGPYILNNVYQAVKVIDKRVLPDSVKARHILKNVVAGNQQQLDEANRLIDSLENVLSRNKSKFAALAEEFSEDLSNNSEGGDLGYFAQGRMVKPFNDACFLNGKEGGLYKVRTQFGVHLIYIEDQKYIDRAPSYKIAAINVPIVPGKETQSAGYDVMLNLISDYPYLAELKEAASTDSRLRSSSSSNLKINDYILGELGGGTTSREIVKWAFNANTSVNDVAQTVHEYTDPVNYFTNKYVVVGLSKILEPGMPDSDDVRGDVEFTVLNQLKAEKALGEISGSNLSAIASQYGVVVDTLSDLNMLNNFVAGLGNEPKVVGAAFGQEVNGVSSPILGNSGVFVVQTLNKNEPGAVSNISSIRRTMAGNKKSGLRLLLRESLKDHHEIKDNRSVFY